LFVKVFVGIYFWFQRGGVSRKDRIDWSIAVPAMAKLAR
jgi:hypothetical protein